MKVKLVLSQSVAITLKHCRKVLKLPQFRNPEPEKPEKFVTVVNDI